MTYHSPAGRPPLVGSVRLPVARPACSPRQLEILGEVIVHGDHKAAAWCLGISLQTVRNALRELHARVGATDNRQAAYLLGWTTIPEGVVREHGA